MELARITAQQVLILFVMILTGCCLLSVRAHKGGRKAGALRYSPIFDSPRYAH